MSVLIAGGGTGGHLFPAQAIAEAFERQYPSAHVVFVGTAQGIESRVKMKWPLEIIPARPLKGRSVWQRLSAIGPLLRSLHASRKIIKKYKPEIFQI